MDLNGNGWMLDDWPIWVVIVLAVAGLMFWLTD